ncbi:unnamed protein product [Allacma fusca]|uniref:Uncharacterized protein n=1 Tax=Allacma fusca TaxID=39272 RepID=A0A8J2JMC2_9HEXA|nr:unnamed protein product [Allacma fusca]
MDQNSEAPNTPKNYLANCDLTIWLRSCRKEILDPVKGSVTFGEIPNWLSGSLVRNGPGGIHVYGDDDNSDSSFPSDCEHLFDSPGLLQKFRFQGGEAFYSNRFVQTNSHKNNLAAKRLVLSEFGTLAAPDPCQTIFHRVSAIFTTNMEELMTDTANISIQPFGDEVYTLAETGYAHRIDLESLDTTLKVNLISELAIINHTSHPHVFEKDNKVYNVGQKLDLWNGPRYVIVELDTNPREDDNPALSPWSRGKILAEIPSRWLLNLCYMHSFYVTENHFIIVEQPLSIFFPQIPINLILNSNTLASALKFHPDEDTLFHVIPRDGKGERKVFKSPAFFFMHTINAFETKEGNIVLDICCYKDPKMIDCLYVSALQNAHENPDYAKMFRGRPTRFQLDMNSASFDEVGFGLAESEEIVDFGCEIPQINSTLNSKPYKYFYAISSDTDLDHTGWLVKVNTESKSFQKWGEPELQSYGSEPIFVQNPGATVKHPVLCKRHSRFKGFL